MRLLLVLPLALAGASTLGAQAALQAAPSTRATSVVTLAYPRGQGPADAPTRTVTVDYGQPHLRGRVLHTDSLVPFEKPWRTGANSHTTLATDVDLVVGGQNVPRGKYIVMTQPGRAGWKLFLQKDAGQDPGAYNPANDVARVDLRHRELATPEESLIISLVPAVVPPGTPARGVLTISWGKFEVATDWSVR